MNQREIALEILNKTIKDNAYSNLLLRNRLNDLKPINRPFVVNLVNGTLRNYNYLLYQVKDNINVKTSVNLKNIIALALYEKYFLKEKDYVLNEYVELAQNKYDKSFINAILRNLGDFKELKADSDENISIIYSLPIWLVKMLRKQYSEEDFNNILNYYQSIPTTYYHLNHKKAKFEDLSKYNINIINDNFFTCAKSLVDTKEFNEGLFYVQDINSSLLVDGLKLNENDTFLDVCSAPGSKLFNALEIVKEENTYGNDLNKARVNLIRNKAKLLGYNRVNLCNFDGLVLKDHLNMKFSKILLDVPCSGIGVFSRKPDLRFHISSNELDNLQSLQKDLLTNIWPLLDDNGILVYSTCTLNKKENDIQVNNFAKNNNCEILESKTIINNLGDCFFYAALKKK